MNVFHEKVKRKFTGQDFGKAGFGTSNKESRQARDVIDGTMRDEKKSRGDEEE